MNRDTEIGAERAARPSFVLAAAVVAALALGGCSSEKSLVDDARPAADIFAEADANAVDGDFVAAAEGYDEVERLYPYSNLAKTAMIRSAESYYRGRKYDEARLAAQRYLDFFPSDADAAYAQYIVALSYYDQISDVERDQGDTIRANQALREVIERYPDSRYARDAALKRDLTLDNLAGKEMQIGRYYLGRGHYIAAINRFRRVVEQYNTTSQTPEALHRLVESYLALGVVNEAQNAAAVLGYNYPGSEWYVDSYALLTGQRLGPEIDEESWLSRNFRKVFYGDQF
ncbi:outer membrane protein assembly factor BamD [Pikeienuella sp. HZG-20]|uniref:outer membrane protein assembly factor BamD n=1 Tax=Paludibacillus litoralis TaxID=3133267 RepID=UPI0030ECAED8